MLSNIKTQNKYYIYTFSNLLSLNYPCYGYFKFPCVRSSGQVNKVNLRIVLLPFDIFNCIQPNSVCEISHFKNKITKSGCQDENKYCQNRSLHLLSFVISRSSVSISYNGFGQCVRANFPACRQGSTKLSSSSELEQINNTPSLYHSLPDAKTSLYAGHLSPNSFLILSQVS